MLGNRIKLLREELGLKQDELAQKLSVSASAIGMYERNLREPNNDLILRFADFFGVSVDYLLGKTEERNLREEDPMGFAKIGFSMKDYNPPTEKQKRQIEDLIKVIMKDNKKEEK